METHTFTTTAPHNTTEWYGFFGTKSETIYFAVNTAIIAVGMLGVGVATDYRVIFKYLKTPAAYLSGVFTQLLLVPLLAWGLTEIFRMQDDYQLSVMIQGCSPGGTTSNMVVYWMGGIVDLSVAMTTTTTILALGMMPFWLYVFSEVKNLPSELAIPFSSLGITLGSLLPPILIGMLLNHCTSERFSGHFSRGCIAFSSIGVLIITIYGTIVDDIIWSFTWQLIIVSMIMPFAGFALGYLITMLPFFNMSSRTRRTVAIEVGLQNANVCAAVIETSFLGDIEVLGKMVVFPLMYYLFQLGYSVLFIALYKYYKRKGYFAGEDEEIEHERRIKLGIRGDLQAIENQHAKELPTSSYKIKSDEVDNSYTKQQWM